MTAPSCPPQDPSNTPDPDQNLTATLDEGDDVHALLASMDAEPTTVADDEIQ